MTDGAAPPQGGKSNKVGKIFVGGLARETTTNGLRAYFEQFGEISDCVVMKVRQTGAPRGFGFVTFASQADADLVVAQRHSVEGKEVEAKPAVPRDSEALQGGGMLPPQMLQPMLHHAVSLGRAARAAPVGQADPGTKKVFVGGLTHDTTEEEFMGYFGNFGPVSDCVSESRLGPELLARWPTQGLTLASGRAVVCDPHTRKPRGFGFITFDSDKAVDRVCAAKFHDLNGKRVEVKRAIPPERIRVDERGPGGAHYGGYGRGRGRGVHPSAFAGNGAAVPFGPGMSGMPGMGGGMYVPGALGGTGGFHPLPPGPLGGVGPMSAAGLSSALGGAPPMLNTGGAVAEGSLGLPGNFVLSNAFINPGSNYGSASVALSAGLRAGYGLDELARDPAAAPLGQPGMTHPEPSSVLPPAKQLDQQQQLQFQQQQLQQQQLQFQQQQLQQQQLQQQQLQQQQLQQQQLQQLQLQQQQLQQQQLQQQQLDAAADQMLRLGI